MIVYNPLIPYCNRIDHQLNIGSLIRINGTPNVSSHCFAINLQCGPSVNPRDDIALHLSPVFTPPPRVVRNSLQSQRWGPEESFGGFPFIVGQGFEVMVLIDSDHFMIAINGQHFTEFRYRIPFNRISYLSIDGEVSIASIAIEASNQSYMPSAPPPAAPFPTYMSGSTHQPMPPMYGSAPTYATGMPSYPPQPSYTSPTYPSGPYPQTSYPTASYANPGHPTPGYPHSPNTQSKGILGGALGGTLGGLAAGAAATSIGSAILGRHHKHSGHKSSPIPIAGLAAGAGAAALGAAVLTGHHPFKKAKKLFKHKGFKHKWHKPKFGKWKHKGWSSGSSSSE